MRKYSGHFYGPLSTSAIISNCSIQPRSNIHILLRDTAESEKTNNLSDNLDRDATYHCLREYFFSLGNAINKPQRLSRDKVRVNSRSIL